MKETISSKELKDAMGEFLNAVRYRGDRYVIEQRGKPAAALVPLHVAESYERSRGRASEIMRDVSQASDLDEGEAMEAALAEVAEVRQERRTRSRKP